MIKYSNVSLECNTSGKILENINIHINDGDFFILVGPSGSGKTTTLKLLNRLIKQTSGDIFFQGKNIIEYNKRELRLNTGYVLQQISLFPNLTVEENISLIPEMKKINKNVIKDKTLKLLEKVGLEPLKYLNKYPHELSGGEKQRVGILRAIIANPKILLMDEPFSALDPLSKSQLQDLIKKLHTEYNMTTLFVTHDINEALKLGDKICVMNKGKVIQISSPSEILKNPANDFVKKFFSKKEADIQWIF